MKSDPLTPETIIRVEVESSINPGLNFICQANGPNWECGRCCRGNLGPAPVVGDKCDYCQAKVRFVRRGPPQPWPRVESYV